MVPPPRELPGLWKRFSTGGCISWNSSVSDLREKVRFVQEMLAGGTNCEKFIRVVNCTPVSWATVRDEREVSHDEGSEEVVVPLRQGGYGLDEGLQWIWGTNLWDGDSRTARTTLQETIGLKTTAARPP